MHGFGSHTYSFWNWQGKRYWVKFHFLTQQGIKNLTAAEAAQIVGNDRESHQRDLFEAIERGDFPKWKLYIQVMPETDAEKVPYHPFDLTKVWPKGDYPLIEVGEFELNKNPENFFADVEQAAFAPGNLRSEEHTSELQSLMRNSYAVFCLKKKKQQNDKEHISTNYSN